MFRPGVKHTLRHQMDWRARHLAHSLAPMQDAAIGFHQVGLAMTVEIDLEQPSVNQDNGEEKLSDIKVGTEQTDLGTERLDG